MMSNQRFSSCGIRTTGGSEQDQPVVYPCTEGLKGGVERTRFFDGMVLESSDLENEQAYWRTKRELTNRALGEGVVWGLRVEWDARTQLFTLGPGYAIDCCGRDLVVTECHTVSSRILADPHNGVIAGLLSSLGRTGTARAQLVLRAVEQPEEARLVCATHCQPGQEDKYEYTRMRETTQLCLVPEGQGPERGPVGDFIDDLKALRAGLSDEERAILFPDSEALSPEAPPLYLIVRIGDEQRVIAPVFESGDWSWPETSLAVAAALLDSAGPPEPGAGTRVHVELRAAEGWALYQGSVFGQGGAGPAETLGEPLAEVEAPLALELSWNLRIPAPEMGETDTLLLGAQAHNLGLTRLFSSSKRRLIQDLFVDLSCRTHAIDPGPGGPGESTGTLLYTIGVVGHASLDHIHFVEDPAPAVEPDCFAALTPGAIFIDEPGKTPTDPRPPILAALYAWLARSLRGLDLDSADASPWSGERLLAAWIYVVAWRLFYGANAVAPDFNARESGRTDLARLLHCLLQRWCYGFLYPGPRCTTEHQGVVLGTVDLGTAGRVSGFDAWDGRRHVLTGPLINHWLGQLGIAPPDIVAGRFVRAICCVAEADAQIPAAMPMSRLAQLVGQDESWTLEWSEFGSGAIALSGGAHLIIGNDDNVADRLAARGRRLLRRDEVSALTFVSRLVSAFGDATAPLPGAPLIQTVIAGQAGARLHLLVPATDAELARDRASTERLRAVVRKHLAFQWSADGDVPSPGPLGESVLEDLMVVLARDFHFTPASLSDPAVTTLVARLREAGTPSIGYALALGAEGLWQRLEALAGGGVEPADVAEVWRTADGLLSDVCISVGSGIYSYCKEVGKPFHRRMLADPDLLDKLSSRWISLAVVEAAAEEVMAMG